MSLIEICLDSVESALTAQAGGAVRIELCDNLLEGGTTPSHGMIARARERVSIPIHVIIRPRGGDFLYSADELEIMRRDIEVVRDIGAAGVVLGVLDERGVIDRQRTAELVALARPMSVTFHKALDMTCDLHASLDTLIELGIERVLSSGGAARAIDAIDVLRGLVERAAGRVEVMIGGGVNVSNAREIIERSGARELHVGSAVHENVESVMRYRNVDVAMGAGSTNLEYTRRRVCEVKVRELLQRIRASAT